MEKNNRSERDAFKAGYTAAMNKSVELISNVSDAISLILESLLHEHDDHYPECMVICRIMDNLIDHVSDPHLLSWMDDQDSESSHDQDNTREEDS